MKRGGMKEDMEETRFSEATRNDKWNGWPHHELKVAWA